MRLSASLATSPALNCCESSTSGSRISRVDRRFVTKLTHTDEPIEAAAQVPVRLTGQRCKQTRGLGRARTATHVCGRRGRAIAKGFGPAHWPERPLHDRPTDKPTRCVFAVGTGCGRRVEA